MRLIIFALVAVSQMASAADPKQTAADFRQLFLSSLPKDIRANPASRYLLLQPDNNVVQAWNADSIEAAMKVAARSSVEDLYAETPADSGADVDVVGLLRRRPVTMVIVPGIFGEFIMTRAFEDILSQESSFATQYKKWVSAALARGDDNASDLSYSLDRLKPVAVGMDKLVQVGSIDDENGKPLVRVVLLFTPAGSMETLGNLPDRAKMMNQRLAKYLSLTGQQQNLVLVGYSRGTTYALEMLAQAQEYRLPWLSRVKGMVALSGVVWGSTSADETVNPQAPMFDMVKATQKLRGELQTVDHLRFGSRERMKMVHENFAAYDRFAKAFRGTDGPEFPVRAAFGIDLIGSSVFMLKTIGALGLNRPVTEYSDNIRRARVLVDEALVGVEQLRTDQRIKWWSTHTLPTAVTYYSITAAMANPEDSEISKAAFDNDLAYGHRSFEDMFLLQNRNDYLKVSGVKLNDSQVAVPQAMFLPNAIRKLNPMQEPLNTQFLGTAGTHHWGMALRIVFEMHDKRVNAYPRRALMQALAAKVALDQEAAK